MMNEFRPGEGVVDADDEIGRLKAYLREQTGPFALVFIDLADSTLLKYDKPQEQWLPTVCRFLQCVSGIVTRSGGRVVKYIGDEVFAVFEDDDDNLAANTVETVLHKCEAELSKLGPEYIAKYAVDYGRAAGVKLTPESIDVLGTCVDRCARIATIAQPHTALASLSFVEHSRHPSSWKSHGQMEFKGIAEPVEVFQLDSIGEKIKNLRDLLAVQSEAEAEEEIRLLKRELKLARRELNMHRRRQ